MDDLREQEVSIAGAEPPLAIHTIGHSVLSIDAFLGMLDRHSIGRLVDVRRHPGSRRHPQFGSEALRSALRVHGMAYEHLPELGGRRAPTRDSPQRGWRNASFRGYADYMQTEAFDRALQQLVRWAGDAPAAIMCAEALPWRCHRALIADALVARGISVFHIIRDEVRAHALPPFARVQGTRVDYPGDAPQSDLPDLFAV